MEQIVVGVSDCRIAEAPGQELVTYALGSCIGLAIYDPEARVGGLLHFMLPDSGIVPDRGRENPYRFADTGIPMLLRDVYARGASKRRMIAAAAGGAQIMDTENMFDIGRRNYQAMRRILWKTGLLLSAEAIGGARSRTIRMELDGGRISVQEMGKQWELVPAQARKGGGAWRTGC